MKTVYSFDVFDTCITRVYARPQDLFLPLACQALGISGATDPGGRTKAVVAARIAAERRARQGSEAEDILLPDIYAELAKDCPEGLEPQAMMTLELSLELASAVAIDSTLALYRKLMAAGERVILVSDMYLPRDCILSMLRSSGYEVDNEQLYLSGDIGLKKSTGSLFTHVLEREAIKPAQMLHHGDHPVSDVAVPTQLGIPAVHVCRPFQCLDYEARLQGRHGLAHRVAEELRAQSRHYRRFHPPPGANLPPAQQIARSRVTAIANILSERRLASGQELKQLHLLGYYIAAPLFVAFVTWLLDTAQREGIRRLYFVARNGQIFLRIAQQICASGAYDIDCRYLYGSRAAWYPSSFEQFDEDFIELLLQKYPDLTLAQIWTDLGMPAGAVRILVDAADTALPHTAGSTDGNSIRAALLWLSKSEHAVLVREHFATSWQTIVDYLDGEGLFEDIPIGVVDIGWHLSAHNALYRILQRVRPRGFTGFYFGVGRKRQETPANAPYHAFHTDVDSKRHSWMFKLGAMSLLEEVFAAANHPTTSGYYRDGERVKPLLKEETFTPDSSIAAEVQACMLQYTELAVAKDALPDLARVAGQALEQFERMYKYPTQAEAQAIAATPIYALTSHSAEQERTLAHPIGPSELGTIVFKVLFAGRDIAPRWVWLSGSMAMSGSFVASAGKLLSFLESALLKRKN